MGKARAEKIIATCRAMYPTFKNDCVEFAAAVLRHYFMAPDFDGGVLADDVVARLRATGSGWRRTRRIAEAIADAKAGMFVLAGLQSREMGSGVRHGHLAIVVGVDGKQSRPQDVVVPIGYAGSIGRASIENDLLSRTFRADLVREEALDYFIRAPQIEPAATAVTLLLDLPRRLQLRSRRGNVAPLTPPMAWGAKVSPEFRAKVFAIAARLGASADHLMAAMAFETAETFSPSIRNKDTGATGLIQFMPSTAESLGTSTELLAAMSAEEQLDYVERYFARKKGPFASLADVYMAILWPRAIGKPDTFILFAKGSKAYAQNSGLDLNADGAVTKHEAAAKVERKLTKGRKAPWLG
jgi:hypothetical protein